MIIPLMVLAIPAFASGFGFVTKRFLHWPGENEVGWGCRSGVRSDRWLATLAILF
jgi:hypothetical protein